MEYTGGLAGAGHRDAASATTRTRAAAKLTWSASRLSFAKLPAISLRSGWTARRPEVLSRLRTLCNGAER
jgi:hypothetical protein